MMAKFTNMKKTVFWNGGFSRYWN